MPEPIIYIRGLQPPIADQLLANPDMIRDLKVIAELSDDKLPLLRQKLFEIGGFLDPKTLLVQIREIVEDPNMAESIRRALRVLTSNDVEPLLISIEKNREEKRSLIDQNAIDRLKYILPELIQPYPGWVRYRKAESLSRVTGNELESIELICDLRPIFDESRKTIEGLMPYTRLRVVVTGSDGLPNSFEAELTRQQVDDLAEKTNKAKEKLELLSKSIQEWVPDGLPDLPLTRILRKETKDV